MARNKASKLIELLEESRPALEAALADAERELEELNQRRDELEAVIARARAALGAPGTQPDAIQHPPPALSHGGGYAAPKARLTLHEAMALVLTENNNPWMSVQELANQINERSLYEKRDRSLVDPTQIHARASKYPTMFEKSDADRSQVRLKSE